MSLAEKLQQVNELQEKISSYGKLPDDVLKKINYKFRLEWNYTSNSMEGNTLTVSETRSVMIGNITVNGKPIKDILEMKGHDEVISSIIKMGKGELNITEKRIKEIHTAIMHEEDPAKKELAGKWKTSQNYLYNYKNERFDFTAPANVPEQMHQLINRLNAEKEKISRKASDALHPVMLALKFNLEYITIHPFYDGNGRTSRILTNLILIAYGYPPLYIKEKERSGYYQYLGDIQGYGGSPDVFYEYMTGLLMRSQQLIIDAVEGKNIEEDNDYLKEITLLKNKLSTYEPNKTPQLIYDIYKYYNTKLWPTIQIDIKQFNGMFSESKTSYTINGYLEEKFETKHINIMHITSFETSTAPPEKKILGYNIYKNDINNIQWNETKYGLKGTKGLINYVITLDISFDANKYKIAVKIKSKEREAKDILALFKNYDEYLQPDEIIEISKQLTKYIITEIKNNIEE